MLLGEFAVAVQAYARETVLNPSDAFAHCRLGDALLASEDFRDCLRSYQASVRLAPRNGYAFLSPRRGTPGQRAE